MNDLPVFPAIQELAGLWPLWILLAGLALLYVFAEVMQRRTARWNGMKRHQELMFLESERQRKLLLK